MALAIIGVGGRGDKLCTTTSQTAGKTLYSRFVCVVAVLFAEQALAFFLGHEVCQIFVIGRTLELNELCSASVKNKSFLKRTSGYVKRMKPKLKFFTETCHGSTVGLHQYASLCDKGYFLKCSMTISSDFDFSP